MIDEPYYCSQQIKIPPDLPDVLKQFTKAAIRTQPQDVLAWSAAYFSAMANGEIPPVKDRLEMPSASLKTDTGLTKGLLKVLNRQLGPKKVVPISMIENKWLDLTMPKELFDDLVRIGNFTGYVQWSEFLALAASSIASDITGAMRNICEIVTHDAEGGASKIPFILFKNLYKYLANIDGDISTEDMNAVEEYLQQYSKKQDGYIMPRNFENELCPNLAGSRKK
ncbi:hypothetical protein HELRODRAFT_80908 [Helobdella robusta]|uniref:RIIa domain-containing protein n=1 Tax=Helobdella robusta TaxID=6412 RepID=T1G470_HELRO|nr:hypothetical protein HELRODRAFT_80908 [Helobdella robusta]ESO03001.1 hypothetical protein HELRODRAFT_80908 [Helobdella robusta]